MKPSIPKGTRDFSPVEMIRRNYIFDTVKEVFNLYGYQPIETPAMENLTSLLGKYGEEGDRLIFRILNSGDFLSPVSNDELLGRESAKLSSLICEKGLRYDLTVPFARYVVQHREEITFPFRRYQLQPVWRGDRPQKGRYREFFQCDVDVIGSDSLLNEYELVKIIDEVFGSLGIAVVIKINNRKILSGIAETIGESARITDITVAIDKLEKIGLEGVVEELMGKGIGTEAIARLKPVIQLSGSNRSKISTLETILSGSDSGRKGVEELNTLFSLFETGSVKSEVELDLSLARGLDYYTGAIIEVKSKDVNIGSICGGGRYDNLTGVFGLEGVSGVGVSFGADRIYDVMTQLDLFREIHNAGTQVMVVNFGMQNIAFYMGLLDLLRKKGISAELYPDPVKLKKQVSYADSRKIPYVVVAGDEEMSRNLIGLKLMASGEQKEISPEELPEFIKTNARA